MCVGPHHAPIHDATDYVQRSQQGCGKIAIPWEYLGPYPLVPARGSIPSATLTPTAFLGANARNSPQP